MKYTIILLDDAFNMVSEVKKYASDNYTKLKDSSDSNLVVYENWNGDFKSVPELYNDDPKILLLSRFINPTNNDFKFLNKAISSFKNVQYIITPRSRYTDLDLDLLKNNNTKYINNASQNAPAVAQYAIGMMYSLVNRFPVTVNKDSWTDDMLFREIGSLKACVIGAGSIGVLLLEQLKNLGLSDVSYFSRSEVPGDYSRVNFQDIFSSDILFICLPTTLETKTLMKDFVISLKSNHYVIDISAQSSLYSRSELLDLLKEDKLEGAAFDISDDLKVEGNYIKTPHSAAMSLESEIRTYTNFLQMALDISKGNTNLNFLN